MTMTAMTSRAVMVLTEEVDAADVVVAKAAQGAAVEAEPVAEVLVAEAGVAILPRHRAVALPSATMHPARGQNRHRQRRATGPSKAVRNGKPRATRSGRHSRSFRRKSWRNVWMRALSCWRSARSSASPGT